MQCQRPGQAVWGLAWGGGWGFSLGPHPTLWMCDLGQIPVPQFPFCKMGGLNKGTWFPEVNLAGESVFPMKFEVEAQTKTQRAVVFLG